MSGNWSAREIINAIRLTFAVGMIVVTGVSGWIVAVRARRRARHALGRRVSDGELVSLNTWMEVAEAEHCENPRTEPRLF